MTRLLCSLRPGLVCCLVALATLLAQAARAQPYGSWLVLSGPTAGWLEVPQSPALNPTSQITIEAWVAVTVPSGPQPCASIAGKNWQKTWWVGVCGTTLRSYVRGYDSTGVLPTHTFRDAGTVPAGQWTHVAVVFDGVNRMHYINGELVGTWPEADPLTTDTDDVRIAGDVMYQHTPAGAIDELRLWSVGRSQDQIRSAINVPLSSGAGLVAVWHLDASGVDAVGGHNGVLSGSGAGYLSFPAGPPCSLTTATSLCLQGRFVVTTSFRTLTPPGPSDGTAQVVGASANSGIFWFFSADNWELMVKAINGCGLNSRYWIYSAATTDRFFRMNVFDSHAFVNKVYFSYAGAPAPAVTDSGAFATCP